MAERRGSRLCAEVWNRRYPIATAVYYRMEGRNWWQPGQTRSPAWTTIFGWSQVLVADEFNRPVPGGVALTHVEPRPELSPC